jgi:hypothetical protein
MVRKIQSLGPTILGGPDTATPRSSPPLSN